MYFFHTSAVWKELNFQPITIWPMHKIIRQKQQAVGYLDDVCLHSVCIEVSSMQMHVKQ